MFLFLPATGQRAACGGQKGASVHPSGTPLTSPRRRFLGAATPTFTGLEDAEDEQVLQHVQDLFGLSGNPPGACTRPNVTTAPRSSIASNTGATGAEAPRGISLPGRKRWQNHTAGGPTPPRTSMGCVDPLLQSTGGLGPTRRGGPPLRHGLKTADPHTRCEPPAGMRGKRRKGNTHAKVNLKRDGNGYATVCEILQF